MSWYILSRMRTGSIAFDVGVRCLISKQFNRLERDRV